ncbi:MAG: type II secretion system protein [Pseudomonadota bacterium]
MHFNKSSKGFTLIEIMLVMVIMGLMAGFVLPRMGIFSDTNVKRSCSKIAGMIRLAYDRATIKNQKYRLVFNIEQNQIIPEVLVEEDISDDSNSEKTDSANKDIFDDNADAASKISFNGKFEPEDSILLKKYSLPNGARISGIRTMHSETEIKEGSDFILFLPNGFAEKAFIYLGGPGESIYTLEINPITGNTTIHDEYVEYRENKK